MRHFASLLFATLLPGALGAQATDPRVGLKPGLFDAQSASSNMRLLSETRPSAGFFNAADVGGFKYANSDLAFRGNLVFQGSFHGMQVWDISTPAKPTLRLAFPCPGGQGDPSVHGNLLFMSVEMPNGRVDCGPQGVGDSVSAERFRGVRIFDISNMDSWRQVAAVQTCRGSHTHTLVTDPNDPEHVYVYVSGTSSVRSPRELAGCSGADPDTDPNTALFQIEVIKVPVKRPSEARIVSTPRIFADSTGRPAGLWRGGAHGPNTQSTAETNQCHDITVYGALNLAAGACSGNGILLDITDRANPKRITDVSDENFAYWHSATFNNDASTVIFTDEWGGGMAPRCQSGDRPEWGANALFRLRNGRLEMAGYYKLPAAQSAVENCVAHNGSLVPVPGRDIMVQAWYQGGVSVFDFSDPAQPVEIAYFDRGPQHPTQLQLGGQWSTYWHNGLIVGSDIGRGLDLFELLPSEHLSADEIAAAKLVRFDEGNLQDQQRITWPPAFAVARAYLDQMVRADGLRKAWAAPIYRQLTQAEQAQGAGRRTILTQLATQLKADAPGAGDPARVAKLLDVVSALAN